MAAALADETLDALFLLGAITMLLLCLSPRMALTVVAANQTVENGGPQRRYPLRGGRGLEVLVVWEQYRGTNDMFFVC